MKHRSNTMQGNILFFYTPSTPAWNQNVETIFSLDTVHKNDNVHCMTIRPSDYEINQVSL